MEKESALIREGCIEDELRAELDLLNASLKQPLLKPVNINCKGNLFIYTSTLFVNFLVYILKDFYLFS
jgi:hypothetical protein